MIGRRALPLHYKMWNARWGAPHGRRLSLPRALSWHRLALLSRGPFAHQENSDTREWEYPWVHEQLSKAGRTLQIVEVGGGLAGMQWVLARDGHDVRNVDPAADGAEWGFSSERHRYLSRIFKGPVTLIPRAAQDVDIPAQSVDVVLSVSVLEHIPEPQLTAVARRIGSWLRRDGQLVLTVDLFLDIAPFTAVPTNIHGRNIDVAAFIAAAGCQLVSGTRGELVGFPEFDAQRILARRDEFLVSRVNSMTQCLVVRPG